MAAASDARTPKIRNRTTPTEGDLREALRALRHLLARSAVTAVGIGEPATGGRIAEGERAVCVYVREKLPLRLLTRRERIPADIDGVRIDVDQRCYRPSNLPDAELRARRILPADPIRPGVQIGLDGHEPGTLGLIVRDRLDGRLCMLTAAHVLPGAGGATVLQPGFRSLPQPAGSLRRSMLDRRGDAAIAVFDRLRACDPRPLGAGVAISGIRQVREGDVLEKSGATTGVTRGRVKLRGDFNIDYPARGLLTMAGFELRPLRDEGTAEVSDAGDSGSVWYDPETGEAGGMTVAGDALGSLERQEFAFCCHLDPVFRELQIELPVAT
jgi:hypothetical protein